MKRRKSAARKGPCHAFERCHEGIRTGPPIVVRDKYPNAREITLDVETGGR